MGEPRTLTVTCPAGMSNRLRVLLSGKALAEATGREFAMQWTPSVACGALYPQLFRNQWNVRADIFFDAQHAVDLTRVAWEEFPDLFSVSDPALFVQNYGWIIRPARYSHHLEIQTRGYELLRELEPIPALAQRVQEFRAKFFRPIMIGAHLRRGDHIKSRPDVTGNLAAVMKQIDEWLEEKSDAGILLCTDDGARDPYSGRAMPYENVADKFVQRYGARVVFTKPSSLDRRSPQAIQDGLMDLWLLRATDFFVGTVGSSFSELAVFGRSIPFQQIAVGTPAYSRRARWLKRLGLYEPLARLGRYEFGRDAPYTSVMARYLIRLRVFLTQRI